ncbi:unnamed protein product, partial [marine sediment metagenome]
PNPINPIAIQLAMNKFKGISRYVKRKKYTTQYQLLKNTR